VARRRSPVRARLAPLPRTLARQGFRFRHAARSTIGAVVFTVEQRDALRERVLTVAEQDRRVVGGAAVGSLASAAAIGSPSSTSRSPSPTIASTALYGRNADARPSCPYQVEQGSWRTV
jgi:hypothetical protein